MRNEQNYISAIKQMLNSITNTHLIQNKNDALKYIGQRYAPLHVMLISAMAAEHKILIQTVMDVYVPMNVARSIDYFYTFIKLSVNAPLS